jgi:hypothetical protein
MPNELATRVFAAVDASDAAAFAAFFADTDRLVFGNGEPMTGPGAITAGVAGFFTTIKGLRHEFVNEWGVGQDTVVELSVEYDRLDGQTVRIPVVSIWHVDSTGLIDDYRVYFDLAPVYAP